MKEHFFDTEKLPKSWDDLSPLQLERACGILHGPSTRLEKAMWLAVVLMGIEKGHAYLPLDEAIEAMAFLLEGSNRTRPPFFAVRLNGLGHTYPPDTALANLSFGEWISADSAFTQYLQTGNGHCLNKLCACLYRPSKYLWERFSIKYNGDMREEFNSNALEKNAKKWEKVEASKKLAILAYFAGSKAKIAGIFTKVFKKAKTNANSKGSGWMKALDRFTDNITQYDTVLTTRLYLVLYSMNEMVKDAEELKERYQQ